jgi:hypothetical protein
MLFYTFAPTVPRTGAALRPGASLSLPAGADRHLRKVVGLSMAFLSIPFTFSVGGAVRFLGLKSKALAHKEKKVLAQLLL